MRNNNGLCLPAACTVHVTIFSTGGKFRLVSNFTELHTLTLAARSYALLGETIVSCNLNELLASSTFTETVFSKLENVVVCKFKP